MSSVTNMQNIFQKLGDLKSFFLFGQKIIPTFQMIIDFMQDTVPLLENVNQSIQDSTSKIPKAALQLNSVTNATEIATTEILDTIDGIDNELTTIKSCLDTLGTHIRQQRTVINDISGKMNQRELAEDLKKKLNHESIEGEIGTASSKIDKIQEGMMNITLSLQVQDITAQQLSSVNHLIQSIQFRLSSLLTDMNNKDNRDSRDFEQEISKNAAFNPDAHYDKEHKSQELADQLVTNNFSKPSQEEIDQLFAQK